MTFSHSSDGHSNNLLRFVDAAIHNLESGIKSGLDCQPIYLEINSMRHADTVNGKLDSGRFRLQMQEMDRKFYQDGLLPHVHIVPDERSSARIAPDSGSLLIQPGQPYGPHRLGRLHAGAHGHGLHHQRHLPPILDICGDVGGSSTNCGGNAATDAGADISAQPTAQGDKPGDNPATVPVAKVPDGQLTMSGAPTITPEKINEVLKEYHSPAAGMGQYIYDQGVKHGINPAMALAFYCVESCCGTKGLAVQNKSWGNVRGHGPHGYRPYDSIKDSLDSWYNMINNLYQNKFHADKLGKVISHYAPNSDGNNEAAYVRSVGQMVRKWQC